MLSSHMYIRRALLLAAATWLTACSAPATPASDIDLSSVVPPAASIDAGVLFTGGTLGAASGTPLRVGWLDSDNGLDSGSANTQAVAAAVTMVNTELNGVGGRPIELVTCADQQLRACSAALAADPRISMVITGNVGDFGIDLRESLGDLPRVGVIATQDDEYSDPLSAFFVLGTPGILRAAATWLTTDRPTGTTVEHVTILVTPRDAAAADRYAGERLERNGIEVNVVVVADVLPDEGYVLRDVRTAVDALGPKSAIINMLGPTGCIALAETLRAAGKDVLVVTSGLCSTKSVHDKLGDWTPGWVHIAGGPDLELYDQDPQAALYRDRLRLYAGPEADWTGHSSLSFAAVLNVVRILSELVADSGDNTLRDRSRIAQALLDYRGPLFTGAGNANCGLDQQRPALCQHQARAYRYDSRRHWVNVTGKPLLVLYP